MRQNLAEKTDRIFNLFLYYFLLNATYIDDCHRYAASHVITVSSHILY